MYFHKLSEIIYRKPKKAIRFQRGMYLALREAARIVRSSDRSNTKPDGGPETLSSSIIGFHLRNCVRAVVIAIESYRFLIVSGNARHVGPGMIEIIMRRKTSETKE
jgi:hypothetical protein